MINKLKKIVKKNKLLMYFLKIFLPSLRDYGRPNYRYLVYSAFDESIKLGYSECTIIEFGVGSGEGMYILKKISDDLFNKFNFKINLAGFDNLGLKNLGDYRDVRFKWKENLYQSDEKSIKKIDFSKIYIGDVKNTLINLKDELKLTSPIAGIVFDLNLYTSTVHAFEIFNFDEKFLLPRIHCYFDDSNTIEYIGERLAIKEYNDKNVNKKLSQNPKVFISNDIDGWAFYEFHNFKNYNYNQFTNKTANKTPWKLKI